MGMFDILRPLRMSQFRRKGAYFSDLLTYLFFIGEAKDGVCLHKNNALSRAYRFTAPDLASSSEAKIAGVAGAFNQAILQLGEGWGVQFEVQRRLSTEYPAGAFDKITPFLVDEARARIFSEGGSHYATEYYLIFTHQMKEDLQGKSKSLFFSGGEEGGVRRGKILGELQDFLDETARACAPLSSRMPLKPLSAEEYLTLIHSCVSLDWHKMSLPDDRTLWLDRVLCDADLYTSMPMMLDDNYIPIVSVCSFPSATLPAMFDNLNKADCEFRWSSRFIVYGRQTARHLIDKKKGRFLSARKSAFQYAMEVASPDMASDKEDGSAVVQAGDADKALIELMTGVHAFGDYTSDIMVWDKDFDVAKEKVKYIANIIGGCGFSCFEETFNAKDAFLSMTPGNMLANVRRDFVSSGNFSHIIPISSVWEGVKSNQFAKRVSGTPLPHLTCSTNYRVPFFLNLNVLDVGHTWISGPTGSGKSTLLALLEAQWLKYKGANVVIFDKDLSARCLTMCAGGIYHIPGKDDTAFQPLRELDSAEDRRWACDFIEILLTEQKVEITAAMRKSIMETLATMGEETGKDGGAEARDLSSFCQYSHYANPETGENDVANAIAPYTLSGQFGQLFDARETRLPLSKWVMFEMNELMKMSSAVVAPALFFMFREVEKMFTGEQTLLVLDEAWVFLKNKTFADKIVDWLKTLRKKNVFVVFATQEIADAVNSPIATTIASQCPTKIYLADDQAASPISRENYLKFGLDEAEIEHLAGSVKQRDYFYKSSLGTRQFQLDLESRLDGGLQLGILTASAKDREILDAVEAEFGRNTGRELVGEILDRKGIKWRHLLPKEEEKK